MKPYNKTDWTLYVLFWVLAGLVCALMLGVHDAHAAKVRVSWIAPTQNNDGSPLTDLTGYRVEWGSCATDGSFSVYQAGINVTAPATATWIYPTGLNPVCVRLYSMNSKNVLSMPAFASGPVKIRLSQPVH